MTNKIKKRRSIRSPKPPLIGHNGYILMFVGYNHHLAAPNGYAYEHRFIAETKLNRKLLPGEIVHHIDGIKTNNHPDNLEVFPSRWHHNAHHRTSSVKRQNPDEENIQTPCECGCGAMIWKFDKYHVLRKFITGHNGKLNKKIKPTKDRQGAHNRNKTHCPNGHEYSPINTSLRIQNGYIKRKCKICHKTREANRRNYGKQIQPL